MASWRTSIIGVITIIVAAGAVAKTLLDGDPNTNPDWTVFMTQVTLGIGLITARDNKVTDVEAVGSVEKAKRTTAVIQKERGIRP